MSLGLYMDEHVPAAITEGLRLRGVDVLTVQEDGRRKTDDDRLISRAGEMGRLLFSRNQDMLRHAERRRAGYWVRRCRVRSPAERKHRAVHF